MKKLETFLGNNNHIILRENNDVFLFSYGVPVASVDKIGRLTLYEDWNYSKTTTKFVYLFIDEYANSIIGWNDAKNKKALLEKLISKGEIKVENI